MCLNGFAAAVVTAMPHVFGPGDQREARESPKVYEKVKLWRKRE